MAHGITKNALTSKYEMAYLASDGVPWHAGETNPTAMADGASEGEWVAGAGMGWKIQRSKVRYFTDREGSPDGQLEMPEQHVLFRSDTKAPLGIVSEKYKIVQPIDAFRFFRELVEGAGFRLTTAGTLFGGKRFWVQASIGSAAEVGKGDEIRGHLLLATSCDGTFATVGKEVITRVVCNNTLTAALFEGADRDSQFKITHRVRFNPEAMAKELGLARKGFELMQAAMVALSQQRMSDAAAAKFVRNLLRPPEQEKAKAAIAAGVQSFEDLLTKPAKLADIEKGERTPRGEAEILRLFHGTAQGSDLPGVRGTAWGMLNAVTEYVDHHAQAKSASHRTASAWFNGGDEMKSTAFQQLLAMR